MGNNSGNAEKLFGKVVVTNSFIDLHPNLIISIKPYEIILLFQILFNSNKNPGLMLKNQLFFVFLIKGLECFTY